MDSDTEDSQQSDEIEIDQDFDGVESAATSEQAESESNAQDQAEEFNTDLPAEHNYLGNLERVSGIQYLEPNKTYRLPIFFHDAIIFPGETLPMILTQQMFLSTQFSEDGLLFGLVFHGLHNNLNNDLYGVTCQIFAKGNEERENISIKSKAYQRFCVKNDQDAPEFYFENRVRIADIRILPEIVLPHPIYGYDANSLSKFRLSEKMTGKLLKFQSLSTCWPSFVFDIYDANRVIIKIKKFLATLKIETVPMDLTSLSFWFSQNAVLSSANRREAFLTNNVVARIFLIEKSLNVDKYIVCKSCSTKLARYDSLFAMSKEGVQTSYCNSAGFIHETHTITHSLPDVIVVSGRLSSEFSWFPGYTWRYVHCAQCSNHLGWKYYSDKPNVVPKTFIGLSGKSISVRNICDTQTD